MLVIGHCDRCIQVRAYHRQVQELTRQSTLPQVKGALSIILRLRLYAVYGKPHNITH